MEKIWRKDNSRKPYKITSPDNFLEPRRYANLLDAEDEFNELKGRRLLTRYDGRKKAVIFFKVKDR